MTDHQRLLTHHIANVGCCDQCGTTLRVVNCDAERRTTICDLNAIDERSKHCESPQTHRRRVSNEAPFNATYECREGIDLTPRLEQPRTCVSHCFRQCTRTIHSTHTRKTSAEHSAASVRTPSVRRQFAVNSGRSSEPPPSAACCLPRTVSHQTGATFANLQTGSVTAVTLSPSALSFPLRRDITPNVIADGTRLPCRAQKVRPGKAATVTEPSPDSPRVFPHASK